MKNSVKSISYGEEAKRFPRNLSFWEKNAGGSPKIALQGMGNIKEKRRAIE